MAHIIEDRVLETTTTTGTGALALVAAVVGYRRFNSGMAVADTCHYTVYAVDANGLPTGAYETGRGTYSGTDTLTRTTVLRSSNANAAVAFAAGSKYVALTMVAPVTATVKADARAALGIDGGGVANLLINGRFNINQRQQSGTVTLAAGVYGHDRWRAGASGCTYTFATSAGLTTITITAGSLQQVVEGVNVLTGTHALSWTGTTQGKIGTGSYSASGVTGALTGGVNATVEFNTGTLTLVQLAQGSDARPFEDRGGAGELFAAQRYCWRASTDAGISTAFLFTAMYQSTTNGFVHGNYPQAMRTTPTLVVEGAAGQYQIYDAIAASYATTTALSLNGVTNAGFFLVSFSVASGGTAGRTGYFATNAQLTSSLRFEAEL